MQVENVENLLLYEIILLSTYKPEDSKDLLRKYLEKKKNNKSRWSFSSILNKTLTSDSIPKPLIKIINKVKYNWSLKLDYSGNYLAVFSENFLEIRNSQNHFSHPIKTLLRPDAYPNLRKISWSYDSKLIAVSYSDGCITVIKNSGQVLCTIKSNTDVVLNGKTSFEKKDFIGFLDPVAVLGIVNPKTLRKCVNDLEESHELISIDFSGYLRSYRFKLEDIDTKSSLKVNISDLEIFSLGTQIYREDKDNNNVLKFSHSFNFGFHYRTLYTGMIDCETLVLVGEVSSNNVVDTFSEWICLNKFPFYQLKSYNNQEFLSSSLNSKSKSIFKAFIRQSVSYLPRHLTSMEESIHTIELSPTGSKFLVVENPGNLKIFQRKPLKLLNEFHNDEILAMTGVLNNKATRFARSTEQENIGTSHNSTDAARSILSVAGWWSEDDVILSFTDGSLVIAKLPTLTNVLGSNAEKFYAPLSLQCRQGEGVFVLENKSETIRYRLSPNNTYVLVRRLDVTESSLQNTMNSKLAFLMKFSTIPLRLFMNAFLGDWEESEVSDIITFQQHQFSLYYIMKSTPLEAMYLKIQLKKYGAALDLAKLYNLDEDPIYKAQWLDLEVDEYSIKDYLSKIHEKDWVLQKCASRVPNNVKNAKLLLQYGLKLTNHITMVDVENEINEVLEEFEGPMSSVRNFTTSQETLADVKKVPVHTICKYRLLFLKYIDRLETHVSIYSPAKIFPSVLDQEALQPFDVHFFQFRDINLIELALNFAINGFVHGLEVLFTRYTEEVLPYRTMILNHFPETYSPVLYTILLPEVEAETEVLWKSIPWRKKDWTENENILEFAGWESEHFEGECGEIYPNTGSHIRQWYDNRARFIEENSGQVDLALELVELGIQKKVKGLSLLRTHLKILFYLVFDESFHCLEVDLSKLESMSHMEIYNLILTETNERNIVEKVKKIILPYIQETDKYSTGCEQIFYACLENASRNHLNWFISLLEGKSFFEPVLFGSPDLIADLILKCCYISEEQEDLDKSYLRILNCIPLINKKSSSTELNGWDHETNLNEEFNVILREKIDLLSMHIRAWEILRFYNLQTPLKWFLESQNIELQRKLLVKLARNAGEIKLRFRYFDADNKFWNTLLERLLELRELKILNLLKLEDIFSEYFVVALNHGKFDLIADLLKRAEVIDNLPFKTIEKLVLDAATESFDNSTSCNMHTGELMMATNCLKLLPESTACQRELALIEAIHQLGLLKVPLKSHQDADSLLLPIQIRLHPNRLELIQQALGLNKQYYVSAGLVIDLSKKLLGAATPIPKVKALIADSALDSSDVEVAWRLCKDLIGDLSFQGNTWRVCLRLAQHSKFRDVDKKLLLVSHVLKCCPSSSLHEALTLWKNLDLEKVKSNDLGLKSSPLNDSASSETLSSFLHKGLSEYSSFSTLKSASSPLKKELVPKLLDSTSTFSPAKNFSDIYNLIEQNLSSPTASSPTRVKNNVNLDALKFKYSFVNFYAPPQCLDINKNETVFNEQKYLERIYLERLLRLNELKKENNEICNDVTQEILENLCSIFLTMDFPYGIGYLLSLTYPTVQYKYLNSLEQNEHVEKLGCYLFSLSACLEITKQKNVFSCKPVDLVSIIENIDSKTFNKHSIAEKCFFATKFLDSLKSKRDIRLLNSLIANSSRKEDARSSRLEASDYRKKDDFKGTLKIKNKNFQEDVLLEGFEMEKFNDENYKKCFMIGLIETFDLKKLEDILKVSGEFGVERKMLLLSYFKWIFTTPHADNDSITKIIDLYQNELLLINDALDVISSVHSNIFGTSHEKLLIFYKLYLEVLESSPMIQINLKKHLISNIAERIKLLENFFLKNLLIKNEINFKTVLQVKHLGSKPLLSLFKPLIADHSINEILEIFWEDNILKNLSYFEMFPEEKVELVALATSEGDSIANNLNGFESLIFFTFFEIHVFQNDWHFAEDIKMFTRDIIKVIPRLNKEWLIKIVSEITVGEKASYVPVNQRIGFVLEVQSYLTNEQLEGKINGECYDQIETFHEHLKLIYSLQNAQDPNTDEKILVEWIRQLDLTFGLNLNTVAAICMRMILSGTSPYLINEICKLYKNLEYVGFYELYFKTINCVVGKPVDEKYFGRVFRKEVDSPVSAIDRIIKSVVKYVCIDLDAGWGFEEEALKEGCFGIVLQQLEKSLQDMLIQIGSDHQNEYSLQMKILDLVETNFGVAQRGVDRSESAKFVKLIGIIKNEWGVEIDTRQLINLDDFMILFSKLLTMSETFGNFLYLLQILLELEEMKFRDALDTSSVWKMLLIHLINANSFDLLQLSILECIKVNMYTYELEDAVLQHLKSVNSVQDCIKIQLLSKQEDIAKSVMLYLRNVVVNMDITAEYYSLDRRLHIILITKGFYKDLAPLRSKLERTLLNFPTRHQLDDEMVMFFKNFFELTVINLIAEKQFNYASLLLRKYLELPKCFKGGLSNRFRILRNFVINFQKENENVSNHIIFDSEKVDKFFDFKIFLASSLQHYGVNSIPISNQKTNFQFNNFQLELEIYLEVKLILSFVFGEAKFNQQKNFEPSIYFENINVKLQECLNVLNNCL